MDDNVFFFANGLAQDIYNTLDTHVKRETFFYSKITFYWFKVTGVGLSQRKLTRGRGNMMKTKNFF